MTETPEQPLLWIHDPAAERSQPASVGLPHLSGRDEQAGVVLGLQPELNPPRRGAGAFDLVGLAKPEARPEHPVLAVALPRAPPLLEALGESGQLQRVSVHDRIVAGQRCEPGLGRRKRAPRSLAPTRDEPARQEAPRADIHDRAQQVADHRLGRVPLLREHGFGPEERRHRRHQRAEALLVAGIGRHRPPAGEPPLVGARQPRKHPAARQELERELDRLGQEAQRVAEGQARRR